MADTDTRGRRKHLSGGSSASARTTASPLNVHGCRSTVAAGENTGRVNVVNSEP
jgi:hypothetical protein